MQILDDATVERAAAGIDPALAGRRHRRRFSVAVPVLRLVPLVVLTALWAWMGRSDGLKGDIFPPPSEIWSSLVTVVGDGSYAHHLWVTGQEFAAAFAVALVAGLLTGLAVGGTHRTTQVFEPLFLFTYALPRIALFPILLTIFGIGMQSKMALGAINGFFPVFVNTLAGMKGISRLHLDVAESLKASRWQRYTKVVLPSIFGPVVTGVRLGVTMAIIGVLVGEIIQSNDGVGFFIFDRYTFLDFPTMYAAILLTVAIVFLINVAVDRIESRLLRWRR